MKPLRPGVLRWPCWLFFRKNMQRNKQVAMGRKKFNMDPKKVGEEDTWEPVLGRPRGAGSGSPALCGAAGAP